MPITLARKLAHFIQLSEVEQQVLQSMPVRLHQVEARRDIVADGDLPAELSLITEGFACRYKILKDGRRQIMAILIPGDICDLGALSTGGMDHGVAALNNNQIAAIPLERIFDSMEKYPRIEFALWRASVLDGALYRQWLINLGRRSAYERVAHLICEIWTRLEAIGRAVSGRYELPVTQSQLADATGLSLVHVNRTLKRLREDGLIAFHNNQVKVLHQERLCAAAEFDPGYLQIGPDASIFPTCCAEAARPTDCVSPHSLAAALLTPAREGQTQLYGRLAIANLASVPSSQEPA
jgi:CRP-like cAMP-binding protein